VTFASTTARAGHGRLLERAALDQRREALVVGEDHLGARVQAHDARRAVKGAQHDHQASVLAQVRDRLGAAADHVEIGDRALVEHAQRSDRPLGRDVDVTRSRQRRARHEEHRLRADPLAQAGVDALEDLAHDTRIEPARAPTLAGPGRGGGRERAAARGRPAKAQTAAARWRRAGRRRAA
jgi:hypothetical protein